MAYATTTPVTDIEFLTAEGYMCISGQTVPKYSAMGLIDPYTASHALTDTTAGIICAGVSAMEKDSADGSTRITLWKTGRFKGTASGSITLGDPIALCGNGRWCTVSGGTTAASRAVVSGYSEETATDGQTFILTLLRA